MSLPARGEWIEMDGAARYARTVKSLPARGEWIEMYRPAVQILAPLSLPARGEWIEIPIFTARPWPRRCLSPLGESGLKSLFGREKR